MNSFLPSKKVKSDWKTAFLPAVEPTETTAPPVPPRDSPRDTEFKGWRPMPMKSTKLQQRSDSPESEIRRLKTRQRKSETENVSMKERLEKTERELKAARDELARSSTLEAGFNRVLDLDDPNEKKLLETEEKLKREHAIEVSQLLDQIDRQASELARMQSLSKRDDRKSRDKLEDRLAEGKRNHMNEVEKLRQMHNHEKAKMKQAMGDQWQAELYHVREEHTKEMASHMKDYEMEISELKKQLQEQEKALSMSKGSRDEAFEQMQMDFEKKMEVMAMKQKSIVQTHTEELAKLDSNRNEELEALSKVLQDERRVFEDESSKQKAKHDDEIYVLKRRYEEELARIAKELDMLKARLNETEVELRETWDVHSAEKKTLDEKIATLTAKNKDTIAAHEEKMKSLLKQQDVDHAIRVDTQLKKIRENHESEIQRLERGYHSELAFAAQEKDELTKKLAVHQKGDNFYKMRLADEKQKRDNALRKYQEKDMELILLKAEYAKAQQANG